MSSLSELRIQLADAKATLRQAKDDLDTTKTIATLNTAGSNDRERKKADEQALLNSEPYKKALAHLHTCEANVERIEAEIDAAKDERTARELACRERNNEVLDRYAAALERLARANPIHTAIDQSVPF
jgi:hypothetical protein